MTATIPLFQPLPIIAMPAGPPAAAERWQPPPLPPEAECPTPRRLCVFGNSKMRGVMIFNLPAVHTCRPSRWCLSGRDGRPACYAVRGNHTTRRTQRDQAARYYASLASDFQGRVVSEIHAAGDRGRIFKIHATGDFYSSTYAQKWIEIAYDCPDTIFRTTTRRDDLAAVLREFAALPNVVLRESLDPSRRERRMPWLPCCFPNTPELTCGAAAGPRNSPEPSGLVSSLVGRGGLFACPGACRPCGYTCWHRPEIHVLLPLK